MPDKISIKKQLKFAVVMYGGGSLAIYINGVAQELLRMAQATNKSMTSFDGTTVIYRKIALLLSGQRGVYEKVGKLESEIKTLLKESNDNDSVVESKREELQKLLRTKTEVEFIIDVLTGSSAGGINAVFLSKALVNGVADMSDLQKLWLEQGDFAKLLNDKHSVKDNPLNVPNTPESLLNSQRMYLELLKALDALDKKADSRDGKPNIDLLDLFVTYTDFRGLPTKIELSDKSVTERVHKRVFNFRYDADLNKNDFVFSNNSFLAFAARCTSSFPVAFEPMCLKNIDEILKLGVPAYEEWNSGHRKWLEYFDDLTDENGKQVDWTTRWFVDGGCLDNKPFGYAIDKLSQRTGEGIVERKLLYIEPNPESFRKPKAKRGKASGLPAHELIKPDAIENVIGQAAGLPSYETIREDLQRVGDHNRLIERVGNLTAEIESDFARNPQWLNGVANQTDWSTADLNDVAKQKGTAFVPYYRLRVSSTTDDIARLVTRYFKIDLDSSYFKAIRFLVRVWRDENYSEYKDTTSKGTLNQFLYKFDVDYRIRRLRFVLQKTEQMLRSADEIGKAVAEFSEGKTESDNQEPASKMIVQNQHGVLSMNGALLEALPGKDNQEKIKFASAFGKPESQKEFINAVVSIQQKLNRIYLELRRESEQLKDNVGKPAQVDFAAKKREEMTPIEQFQADLQAVELQLSEIGENKKNAAEKNDAIPKLAAFAVLEKILKEVNFSTEILPLKKGRPGLKEELAAIFKVVNIAPLLKAIDVASVTLGDEILNLDGSFLRRASREAKRVLGISTKHAKTDETTEKPSGLEEFVQNYLRNYYLLFDSYDQISFPLYFESPVGEAVKVDVVRISSRDAHSLINEEDPNETRRKLAGDFLFAFGAFLDPRWRLNDIMWGRLDGAERLIQTLLPGDEFDTDREALIREANETILHDLLLQNANESFQKTIVEALTLASTDSIQRNSVDKLVRKLEAPAIETGLTDALTCAIGANKLSDYVKKEYEVNRKLEPEPTFHIISRSTQIIGGILQSIADENALEGNRLSWIARLGQIFWGLVTVAAPNGIWNAVFNHWLQLLYVFEIILIIATTIFSKPDIQQFGIVALIVTIGLHLTVIGLQDVLLGKPFWKTLLRFLIGGTLAIAVIAGALFIYSLFFDQIAWETIVVFQETLAKREFARWQKIIFIVPFMFLFVFLTLWREVERLNLPLIGRWLMGSFVALGGVSYYFLRPLANFGPNGQTTGAEIFVDGTALNAFVTGLNDNSRASLQLAFWIDSLLFVPVYLSVLLVLVALVKRRRHVVFGVVAPILAVLTVAGVAVDLLENYYSLFALSNAGVDWDATAGRLSVLTPLKWSLVFVVFGGVSSVFFRWKGRNWWNLMVPPLLVGAIMGLVGTFNHHLFLWGVPLLPCGVLLIATGLLISSVAFQFKKPQNHFFRGF